MQAVDKNLNFSFPASESSVGAGVSPCWTCTRVLTFCSCTLPRGGCRLLGTSRAPHPGKLVPLNREKFETHSVLPQIPTLWLKGEHQLLSARGTGEGNIPGLSAPGSNYALTCVTWPRVPGRRNVFLCYSCLVTGAG